MGTTGTFTVQDLLAVKYASAAEFGLDKIWDVISRDLNYYNGEVREALAKYAEPVTIQSTALNASGVNTMTEVDELGLAPSQKLADGETVSFPLKLFRNSIGWSSVYFKTATPAEVAAAYNAMKLGHQQAVLDSLKKAVYNNANFTFVDKNYNGVSLTVKRFYNNDGVTPVSTRGGTTFASSHNHFVARAAALANSDVNNLIELVAEHDGNAMGIELVINKADKASIVALSDFKALASSVISYNASDVTVTKMDNSDLENQLIGYFGSSYIPVWVKPWAVRYYVVCFSTESTAGKPLAFRERPQASLQGLRLSSQYDEYPLAACRRRQKENDKKGHAKPNGTLITAKPDQSGMFQAHSSFH